MTPIHKLKGITSRERSLLEKSQILTVEQLWIAVGKDETEIDRLGNVIGSRSRLLELLTTDGLRQTSTLGDSWLARHWLDLLLGLVLIVMIFLLGERVCRLLPCCTKLI